MFALARFTELRPQPLFAHEIVQLHSSFEFGDLRDRRHPFIKLDVALQYRVVVLIEVQSLAAHLACVDLYFQQDPSACQGANYCNCSFSLKYWAYFDVPAGQSELSP